MAKAIKCRLRLHGSYKETLTEEFESISKAKEWVALCWDRPYTIVPVDNIIKFCKRIQIPDEYEEKTFIIPDSEYRINKNNRNGYKGWVIITGLWETKSSTFGAALSFSPDQFKALKKFIK